MRMRQVQILIFFFFVAFYAKAQFPYAQKFSHPAQLPTQVIYDMMADKQGYIWIGTDKGLFRFNGHSFTEIVFAQTKLRSVSYLQQDEEGIIWCMNFYKELFYVKNDTLRKFNINDKWFNKGSILLNVSVAKSDIWISAVDRIYQISKKSGLIVRSMLIPDYIGVTYTEYGNGKFYGYSGRGYLFEYPSKERVWKKVPSVLMSSRLMYDGKKVIGASIGNFRLPGFMVVDTGLVTIPAIDLNPNIIIYHFASTGDSKQWICSQTGAYLWETKTGKTTCVLPNESVTDVVKDFQGNYWIGTLDNGLFVCPSLGNLLYKINSGNSLDNITRIDELNNAKVITGSSKGILASFDVKENKQFKYDLPFAREIEFIKYDPRTKLIFTNRGVLKEFEKTPIEKVDYSKQIDHDIYGNILVASFNRAYILNNKYGSKNNRMPKVNNKLYERFRKSGLHDLIDSALIIRDIRANTLLHSTDATKFWIAYEDALYAYHYNGYFGEIKNKDGQSLIVRTLAEDNNGKLIAGTTSDGVFVIENGKVTNHYSKKNGLKSNNIKRCRIFNNTIWALTDESLEIIDPEKGRTNDILDAFGFEEIQVNDFTVNSERFFLATTNGLLVGNHNNSNKYQPIRFTKLEGMANGVSFNQNQVLAHNNNNINFQIEALHYTSATSLFYTYKLSGVDSNWRTASYFINTLTYNRLASGSYTLQIRASDAGGKFQSELLHFHFDIRPPFWKRWWFVFSILLSILALAYFGFKWWTNRLLTRETLREQLFKSQLVALRSQMNPHFLYNVLNTVQGLVYDNKKIEAGNLLGNFSDLMRKTLESSDKQLETLANEIENLRLYLELEKARFDSDFSFIIDTNIQDDATQIFIPSLLLQPLAENAVKHGLMHKNGEKQLSIRFDQITNGLKVQIDDNGIGRKQSMMINARNKNKPESFATKALDARIALFNKLYTKQIEYFVVDKIDDIGKPLGTLVELLIPNYNKN